MTDSILTSTKSKLGMAEDYEAYDDDVITEINAAIAVLTELGVGPKSGFAISSKEEKWSDFVTATTLLSLVKQFIWIQCRITFDPPANSFTLQALQEKLNEYTFRISIYVDPEDQEDLWTDD